LQAVLWVLNLSDGANSLLDVAERSAIPFALVAEAADTLVANGLLAEGDRVSGS
jgi:aminopeptidase-like protein